MPTSNHAEPFSVAVADVRAGGDSHVIARSLIAELSDRELLGLLDGDMPQWKGLKQMASVDYHEPITGGRIDRLGIPGIRFTDGPRGILLGNSTSFPVAIARAATFDPHLEREVGEAMGKEARALGANLFAGICVNLVRHPGWGRAQESYGEDPVLLAAMGVAVTEGARQHVMTCVKHFALNSIENSRFKVDVRVDENTLHEVYLPHFRAVIDAGVDSVMSAYNSVNGEWAGKSRNLLTGVLRDEWGFDGFVMTDFLWSLRNPIASVAAGQDLEMPVQQQRARSLPKALKKGTLNRADVERAATRIVATELRYCARITDTPPGLDVVASPPHRALARRVAHRAAVLLQNEVVTGAPLLPLDSASLNRIAVLGELADAGNQGDEASSKVRPPEVSTILSGLREALGEDRVTHATELDEAVEAARAADAAVVVAGLTLKDEGEFLFSATPEMLAMLGWPLNVGCIAGLAVRRMAPTEIVGGDRTDLHLPAEQVALIRAVAAVNPRTIVVLIGGGAIMIEEWRNTVAAILLAWYPGMEGGRAIADLLTGLAEPGGRLPFAIPESADGLPPFDPDASEVDYNGLWGQRLLDDRNATPAYPFGFGLSYTDVTFSDFTVREEGQERVAQVTAHNNGARSSSAVAQFYAHDAKSISKIRQLVGFTRINVPAGESRVASVRLDLSPLRTRLAPGDWHARPGDWVVAAAQHSRDYSIPGTSISLPAI